MKRLIVSVLLISIAIGGLCFTAISEDAKDQDKIQRTTGNVALGWTEVPKAITQVTKDTDNPFLGITVGLLKGVANAFARTVSGIVDAATLHKPGDDEIIKPTMVEVSESSSTK